MHHGFLVDAYVHVYVHVYVYVYVHVYVHHGFLVDASGRVGSRHLHEDGQVDRLFGLGRLGGMAEICKGERLQEERCGGHLWG